MAQCTARVILAYAPQETETVETREEFYTELEIEISKCRMADELPLVLGDLNNAKLIHDDNECKATTPNGRLLLQLIKDQELEVLNFDGRCQGKWTHVISVECCDQDFTKWIIIIIIYGTFAKRTFLFKYS